MQVKKQQLEPDMEQETGSKLEKEYISQYTVNVYCHLVYLTYMQNTLCKVPGRMKHKLEWKLAGRNINNLRYQMTLPLWQKAEKN